LAREAFFFEKRGVFLGFFKRVERATTSSHMVPSCLLAFKPWGEGGLLKRAQTAKGAFAPNGE